MFLLLFHLSPKSTVFRSFLSHEPFSFQTVRNDESLVLINACSTYQEGRQDDAQCQIFRAEEFFAIGKEGGKEGLGAIAQRDACREEKEQGCLPPRHAAVFLLLFACQIKCHRQEEKRHAEMVIHKGDEQHVGKGKKHRCEHIAVYSLQLHYLSEDSSEEEGGVGGEECHHHRHDGSCPVAGGEFYQPAVQ